MGQAFLIPVDVRFPGAWDTLRPYFLTSLTRGGGDTDWGIDAVSEAAHAGVIQLWAMVHDGQVFGGAATVEAVYPRRRVLEVLLWGTDPHTDELWLDCVEQLKSRARAAGLSALVSRGRVGWARKIEVSRIRTQVEFDL